MALLFSLGAFWLFVLDLSLQAKLYFELPKDQFSTLTMDFALVVNAHFYSTAQYVTSPKVLQNT